MYSLLCPNIDNYMYYKNVYTRKYTAENSTLTTAKRLEKWQELLVTYYEGLTMMPVLNLILNMSLYVIVMIYLIVYILKDKEYQELLMLIPNIMTFAACIASPVILKHPRYVLPIVYTMPIIFVLYIQGRNQCSNK